MAGPWGLLYARRGENMAEHKSQYTAQEHDIAAQKICDALDALLIIAEQYSDVIAIPEVITLHDITEYRVNSVHGPAQFKELYGKETAEHVLKCFAGAEYITPETFEDTIVRALNTTQE